MKQESWLQEPGNDVGPINLGVKCAQLACEVKRAPDEGDQAEDVKMDGPWSAPPACKNEQAYEEIEQADHTQVTLDRRGLFGWGRHPRCREHRPITGKL